MQKLSRMLALILSLALCAGMFCPGVSARDDGRYWGSSSVNGYGTYDNEDIPDHPMLSGITDSGLPFRIGGE